MPQPARGKDMGLLYLHSLIYFIGENLVLGFLSLCPLALVSVFLLLGILSVLGLKCPSLDNLMPLSELPSINQLLAVTDTDVFRWSCMRELVAMLCFPVAFFPELPWYVSHDLIPDS